MADGLELLPVDGDAAKWNERERALMESIGLRGTRTKNVQRNGQWQTVTEQFEAPRAIVEQFLAQCRRTQLDPILRQIYCIERGGKWGIQASIDGFRLVAERTGQYRGQTPAQWTADGITWTEVWIDEMTPPAAARIGIYRDDFSEPLWAVATYSGYVPRDKNGNPKPTGQWLTNPSNQLLKCAEMLGLRKAFPQDLSGVYGTEEMDQAGNVRQAARGAAPEPARRPQAEIVEAEVVEAPPIASKDYRPAAAACRDRVTLREVYRAAEAAGDLGRHLAADDPQTVNEFLRGIREPLPEVAEEWAPTEEAPSAWQAAADLSEEEAAEVARFELDVPPVDEAHPDYVAPEAQR